MAEAGWLGHAAQIGWFEFRRSVRALRQNKGRLLMQTGGPVLFPVLGAVIVAVFAEQLRGVHPTAVPAGVAGYISVTWLFFLFMIASRTANQRDRIEAEPLVLTTVSARTVAFGLAIAELLRLLVNLLGLILLLTGTSVLVFGSLAGLVTVPLASFLFAGTLVVVGQTAGYGALWVLHRSPFVRRHKLAISVPLGLLGGGLYPLFIMSDFEWNPFRLSDLDLFPVGWVADLIAVGTPLVGSTARAGGVVVFSTLVFATCLPAIERLTAAFWFDEPVSIDDDTDSEPVTVGPDARSTVGPVSMPRWFSQPTRRVAEWSLLRTVREPRRLVYLMFPLVFGSQLILTQLQSGGIDRLLAPVVAITLAILVGEIVAMNPLGDEGSMLPVTVTAVAGQQFVRGLCVPGVLFGVPLVVLLTGLSAVVSPYSITTVLVLLCCAGFVTTISVVIAPAIGMALPRYSAISVGRSQEVRPARMSAILCHAAAVGLPGSLLLALVLTPELARMGLALVGVVPGLVLAFLGWDGGAQWFQGAASAIQGLSAWTLQSIGPALLVLGGLLTALVCYLFAIERFESYELS